MSVSLANTDKLLTTTRAVRRRLDYERPVDREIILDAVEVALQAPNTIPAQFVIVDDERRRKLMGDLYSEAHLTYLDEVEGHVLSTLSPSDATKFKKQWETARWATKNIHRAPFHVHVLAENAAGYEGVELAGLYGCILPPAWSFMLALRARGIGASWTTVHLQDQYINRLQDILGYPDGFVAGVFLPCAYYTGEDFKTATRPPADVSVHWNRW